MLCFFLFTLGSLNGCDNLGQSLDLPSPHKWQQNHTSYFLSSFTKKGWKPYGVIAQRLTHNGTTIQIELREQQQIKLKRGTQSLYAWSRSKLIKGRLDSVQWRHQISKKQEKHIIDLQHKTAQKIAGLTNRKHIIKKRADLLLYTRKLLTQSPSFLSGWMLLAHRLAALQKAKKQSLSLHSYNLKTNDNTSWKAERILTKKLQVYGNQIQANCWFVHEANDSALLWLDARDGELLLLQTSLIRLKREGVQFLYKVRNWAKGQWREETVKISGGASKQIGASITWPTTLPPPEGYPGVVLLHGSGSSDRDANLPTLRPETFRKLAQELTARGFAVLRFDKAGSGETPLPLKGSPPFQGIVKNALATTDYLLNHPLVDSKKVALIGHSEGGWVAPILAQKRPQVRAVVALGGSIRTSIEVIKDQLQLILKLGNYSPRFKRLAIAQQSGLLARANRVLKRLKSKKIKPQKKPKQKIEDVKDPLQMLGLRARGVFDKEAIQQWISSKNRKHPYSQMAQWLIKTSNPSPLERIKKLHQPVLMLFGSADFQVPAKPELKQLRQHFKNQKRVQYKVLKGLDHLFVDVKGKAGPGLYLDPRRELNSRVIQNINVWLKKIFSKQSFAQRPTAPSSQPTSQPSSKASSAPSNR